MKQPKPCLGSSCAHRYLLQGYHHIRWNPSVARIVQHDEPDICKSTKEKRPTLGRVGTRTRLPLALGVDSRDHKDEEISNPCWLSWAQPPHSNSGIGWLPVEQWNQKKSLARESEAGRGVQCAGYCTPFCPSLQEWVSNA